MHLLVEQVCAPPPIPTPYRVAEFNCLSSVYRISCRNQVLSPAKMVDQFSEIVRQIQSKVRELTIQSSPPRHTPIVPQAACPHIVRTARGNIHQCSTVYTSSKLKT